MCVGVLQYADGLRVGRFHLLFVVLQYASGPHRVVRGELIWLRNFLVTGFVKNEMWTGYGCACWLFASSEYQKN